jgi:anti-anti-sigma factor
MTFQMRTVVVKQVPATLNAKQERLFFLELKNSLNVERPCIVLDCSNISHMDKAVVHLLLCCLEEAMKRNGDVRLAAISAATGAILRHTGVDRLFEIFDTNAEAVSSFRRNPIGATAHSTASAA